MMHGPKTGHVGLWEYQITQIQGKPQVYGLGNTRLLEPWGRNVRRNIGSWNRLALGRLEAWGRDALRMSSRLEEAWKYRVLGMCHSEEYHPRTCTPRGHGGCEDRECCWECTGPGNIDEWESRVLGMSSNGKTENCVCAAPGTYRPKTIRS